MDSLPRTWFLVLGSALLSGCAVPKRVCEEGGQAPRVRPLFFSMKVVDKGQLKGHRVVRKGGVVRSGERYYLSIDVPERAYLYVVQESADGQRQQLWPQPEGTAEAKAAPWDPAATFVLPREGELALDQATGKEALYVVASAAPLSAERLAEEVKAAPDARDSEESTKVGRGEEERAYSCADPRGVLSLRFPFQHQ